MSEPHDNNTILNIFFQKKKILVMSLATKSIAPHVEQQLCVIH